MTPSTAPPASDAPAACAARSWSAPSLPSLGVTAACGHRRPERPPAPSTGTGPGRRPVAAPTARRPHGSHRSSRATTLQQGSSTASHAHLERVLTWSPHVSGTCGAPAPGWSSPTRPPSTRRCRWSTTCSPRSSWRPAGSAPTPRSSMLRPGPDGTGAGLADAGRPAGRGPRRRRAHRRRRRPHDRGRAVGAGLRPRHPAASRAGRGLVARRPAGARLADPPARRATARAARRASSSTWAPPPRPWRPTAPPPWWPSGSGRGRAGQPRRRHRDRRPRARGRLAGRGSRTPGTTPPPRSRCRPAPPSPPPAPSGVPGTGAPRPCTTSSTRRTGRPADPVWRSVSVAATTCSIANAAATATIVKGGAGLAWLSAQRLPARLVDRDGAVHLRNGWPGEPTGVAA